MGCPECTCTGWAVWPCAPGASSTPAATPGLPAHLSTPRPIRESLTAEPCLASQSRASVLRSWESSGFLQLQVGPHPQGHVTEERGQEDGLDGAFRGTLLPLAPAPEVGRQVWSETSTQYQKSTWTSLQTLSFTFGDGCGMYPCGKMESRFSLRLIHTS